MWPRRCLSSAALVVPAVFILAVTPWAQELPPGDGADLVRARCQTCHGADLIVQQRLSRDGWSRELDKMAGWGAVIEPVDRERLLASLTSTPIVERPGSAGDAILKARCLACHDLGLIEQQRLTLDGWRREVEKMIGWGATVTEPEKDTLAAYLAGRAWDRPARVNVAVRLQGE